MDDSLLGRSSFVHFVSQRRQIFVHPHVYPSFLLGLKRMPTLFGTNLGGGGGGDSTVCVYVKPLNSAHFRGRAQVHYREVVSISEVG